jgi:hypothetical protein
MFLWKQNEIEIYVSQEGGNLLNRTTEICFRHLPFSFIAFRKYEECRLIRETGIFESSCPSLHKVLHAIYFSILGNFSEELLQYSN